MDSPLFRKMEKRDVKRMAELERLCFSSPWSELALRGELKNPVAHYTVLELGGVVMGYAGMWVLFDEAHVTNVAVHPDLRRRGLGLALMRHLMRRAVERGATCMTLEVREGNLPAQTLYYSIGFTQQGRRKGYYADSGEDALILWNRDIAGSCHGREGSPCEPEQNNKTQGELCNEEDS